MAADVASAAQQHMLQARAAWRLLHGPDSSQEPVAIMLPKLERRELPVNSPEAKAAAAAAAAARLERAEAAAQAAALRAASLAGASGLPYRPPEGLTVDLSGVDVVSCAVGWERRCNTLPAATPDVVLWYRRKMVHAHPCFSGPHAHTCLPPLWPTGRPE